MSSQILGIVADDLTGAVDTAGSLGAKGLESAVSLRLADDLAVQTPPEVLCYNTQTRNLAPSEVAPPVRRATRLLVRHGYPRLFKKVDSTLRGHIGLEVSAMMAESGAPWAFVAPAFPTMGRTQRDGLLYVGGRPLKQAQEGSDPLSRFGSPSVVELLREQTAQPVGLVDLAAVDDGEAEIESRIRALIAVGCTVMAFDALSQEHLARIDAVLARRYPDGLLVGSAGLASAMAARVGKTGRGTRGGRPPGVTGGHTLLVSGSLNSTTLAQLDRVRAMPHIRTIAMDTNAILGSPAGRNAERRRARLEACAALERGEDVCLIWGTPDAAQAEGVTPGEFRESSLRLNSFVQEVTRGILKGAETGGLALVGGDTAHAVLTGLRAREIVLETEVLPGISMGRIVGGSADSRAVVAKAGGFGPADALVRVIEFLRRGRLGA